MSKPIAILETLRLQLRLIDERDIKNLTEILSDPAVMRFAANGPEDRAQVMRRVERWKACQKMHGFSYFGMISRELNTLIGYCGLAVVTVEGESQTEIGWVLDRAHWGQGLATEAATAVRDYALGKLKIPRLIAIIHPQNGDSLNIAKKLGMSYVRDSHYQELPVQIFEVTA